MATNNLMPTRQFIFWQNHATIEQVHSFYKLNEGLEEKDIVQPHF